jgi:hypothetical protein
MPLIKNFARLLWTDFHPGQSLADFLNANGQHCTLYNAVEEFQRCEEDANAKINIETYFEFFWNSRDLYQTKYGPAWWNVLYHGILNPLVFRMLMVFHENGGGWKAFPNSDRMARTLRPGDLVLNLNYDTIFDIATSRIFPELCYLPNKITQDCIAIAKPHGSLNLLVTQHGFSFGSPENTGAVPPKDAGFHYGFLPPRLNKSYAHHEIAERILQAIPDSDPTILTLWGVSLTVSDVDLVALFGRWARAAKKVEAINPSRVDVANIASRLGVPVIQFASVDDWLLESVH